MSPKHEPEAAVISNETATVIRELVLALGKQGDPLSQSGVSEARKNVVRGFNPDGSERTGKRFRLIPGVSSDTGATFVLLVIDAPGYAMGKVMSLLEYKHPMGIYRHVSEGGMWPDGAPIFVDDRPQFPEGGKEPYKQSLNPMFLQARWEQFFKHDLTRILGNNTPFSRGELKLQNCANPDAVASIPWIDSSVYVEN